MRYCFLFLFFASSLLYGQDNRNYIKSYVSSWGTCKNVALTMEGGDVAISGLNAFAYQGVPAEMAARLAQLNEQQELIDDIVLTEAGRWFILFADNGYYSDGAPAEMLSYLQQWNSEGEVINAITFNDSGDWVIIGQTKYAASTTDITYLLNQGSSEHGELWTACLTEDGMVAVYEGGYKYLGNVPYALKEQLKVTNINVWRLKFLADGSFFFADIDGNYSGYF